MKYIKYNKTVFQITAATLFALALVATSFFVSAPASKVSAGTPSFTSQVTVTNPKPPEVRKYSPGAAMNFHADFTWTYCSNEGSGTVYGRTTQPVLVGKNHTGFSGWKQGSSVGHPYTSAEIDKLIANAVARNGGNGRGGKSMAQYQSYFRKHFPRSSSFVDPMRAPRAPGKYHFRYELEVRTPQGNVKKAGQVFFEVTDGEADGGACPGNQISIIRNNAPVCVPRAIDLTCSASPSKIEPGESVTFTANANQQVSFTWYNGSGTGGAVIGGPQSGTQSSLTRTYSNPGIYQVTALARNASGEYGMCTRGVTVGDVEDEDEFEEVVDEFGNIITDETITTPDGETINLNPSAGPATITFELDPTITNTTCKGTWVAQNVAKCYMVAGDDVANAPTIANSGNQDLKPAKYQVQCLSLRDGSIAKSPERLCRSNLNTRED